MTLQPESNKQLILSRLQFLYYPVVLLFLVLAARLWQLQIIHGSEYALRAEQNRIRTIQLVAPRGTILDRNGKPLVENRASFNILLYRESITNVAATTSFVVEKLGVKQDDFTARLRRGKRTGLYRPIVIKEDVGIDLISVVEAHRHDHPEIQLGPEPRRHYRYGSVAAHLLGYVGEVSERELVSGMFPGVRTGDLVGKSGVERVYSRSLTGKDGQRQVMVDSLGREVGLLSEVDPAVGRELQLTLDLPLQLVAERVLEGKVGVALAMDPRNGEVLAMASSPSFDPNSFSTRISEEDWSRLINNPDHPLQNRAIQNSYSPGSIFKLVMAVAALEEGLIQDQTRVYCSGAAPFYNRVFHCWSRGGHGYMGLEAAITKSCNIFFYEMGRRMGISRIAEHARSLGLGEISGIDLPGERAGLMPSPEWKKEARGAKWYAGETISVAIGQGAVSTTPLQVLRAVSGVAMDGKLATPHVLLRAERLEEGAPHPPGRQLSVAVRNLTRVRDGMWGSVNSGGTGHRAGIAGLDICGKTGTVQVVSRDRKIDPGADLSNLADHSWFAGFASRDNPEIAVVVFLEHGGGGGQSAAPLARELFLEHFADRLEPQLITRLGRETQDED